MIQRSPAENYLKYLIAHPDLYDDAYIRSVAVELKLDFLGTWYIQNLRGRVNPPTPFYPEDVTHRPSQRFLLREMLEKVFNPDANMRLALRILHRARARELVETMVLSGAPNEAISYALSVRAGVNATVESVHLFKHYFWDVQLLDTTEVRALLDMRSHSVFFNKEPDAERSAQYSSIQKMRHTDPRVVAARLPMSPITGLLAQMQLGILPRDVDLAEVVKMTRSAAALRTMEAVLQGGPAGAQMAASFSLVADVMNRLMDSVVRPEDQLRKDLQKISLATSPNKVPTIKQLTAGNHTTNVHPEPKPETEEEEEEEASIEDNADST